MEKIHKYFAELPGCLPSDEADVFDPLLMSGTKKLHRFAAFEIVGFGRGVPRRGPGIWKRRSSARAWDLEDGDLWLSRPRAEPAGNSTKG